MRTPFAPVQTGPAECAPAARGRIDVNAETGEELPSRRGQGAAIGIEFEPAPLDHGLRDGNAKFAGEMVVAGPRVAHLGIDPGRRAEPRRTARRDRHHPLQHLRHQRGGQPVEPPRPPLLHHQELSRDELRQMRTRGLRRDPGDAGQIAGAERAAVHQRRQDVGAAGIGHQLRDFGKLRSNGRHGASSLRVTAPTHNIRTAFRRNASITIELFTTSTVRSRPN